MTILKTITANIWRLTQAKLANVNASIVDALDKEEARLTERMTNRTTPKS